MANFEQDLHIYSWNSLKSPRRAFYICKVFLSALYLWFRNIIKYQI